MTIENERASAHVAPIESIDLFFVSVYFLRFVRFPFFCLFFFFLIRSNNNAIDATEHSIAKFAHTHTHTHTSGRRLNAMVQQTAINHRNAISWFGFFVVKIPLHAVPKVS